MMIKKSALSAVPVLCFLCMAITFYSCNKEKNIAPTHEPYKLLNWLNTAGFNTSANAIANAVQGHTQEVSIMDNPNYGVLTASTNDIYFSGKSNPGLTININGDNYTASTDGQWMHNVRAKLNDYFDNDLTIIISKGAHVERYTLHQPQKIIATNLLLNNSTEISRAGNIIHWNADAKNTSQKILLSYTLYDNAEYMNGASVIKTQSEIVDDDGEFSLDNILADAKVKRIAFKLVRGNAISFMDEDDKMLFHISCVDHHEYVVK
jgi:hypothetical protein